MLLILFIVVLLLAFGGGGGYWYNNRNNNNIVPPASNPVSIQPGETYRGGNFLGNFGGMNLVWILLAILVVVALVGAGGLNHLP